MALGDEICNLFGTGWYGFQVGMNHGVAEEQNSCVFSFWHSHVHTRLFSFKSHYKQQGLGASLYIQEERVWNGFQDTYLSVVERQAWICEFSQNCMYTQYTPCNINRDFQGISTTDVVQRLKEKNKEFVKGTGRIFFD